MSRITIDLVHGGFVLTTPAVINAAGVEFPADRVEVFTSQGKLMKALRAAIDDNSLVVRTKGDVAQDEFAQGGS